MITNKWISDWFGWCFNIKIGNGGLTLRINNGISLMFGLWVVPSCEECPATLITLRLTWFEITYLTKVEWD